MKLLGILLALLSAIFICFAIVFINGHKTNKDDVLYVKQYPTNLIVIERSYKTWENYLTYIIDTSYNICLVKHLNTLTCVPCSTLKDLK